MPGPPGHQGAGQAGQHTDLSAQADPSGQPGEHRPHRGVERDADQPGDVPRRQRQSEQLIDQTDDAGRDRRQVRGGAGGDHVGIGEPSRLGQRHGDGLKFPARVRSDVALRDLRQEEALDRERQDEDEESRTPRLAGEPIECGAQRVIGAGLGGSLHRSDGSGSALEPHGAVPRYCSAGKSEILESDL